MFGSDDSEVSFQTVVARPPAGTIPDAPAPYQFKDADGRVIYVSSSIVPCGRACSNYFADPRTMHPRTARWWPPADSVD